MFSVYAFLYIPIVILIVYSFNQSKYSLEWKGFTLKWYESLAGNSMLIDAALNSVLIGVLSATSATILGTLGAVVLYRYRFRGKKSLYSMIYIVIMSPDIVMGISLLVLFVVVHIELGFTSLLMSHITFNLPFVIVTVFSRLSGFDNAVIEAAKDLGAGEFTVFRKIILPMTLPAVVSGWLLSFTLSMDDVIISFFVTGPSFEILPLRIYSMVRLGVKPEVNALCAIIFMVSLLMVIASQILIKERRR
ncbi:spermidine/putrescine ABC transporter permease PotC [Limisalsivibrio acetivorans]|uniref:spermidine/putrescine ABC transporter permease PotC n=1 Tax=Limisalsivibrio acetivorans TaxID=1304888 RepID=UPI0012DE3DE4